MPYKKAKKKSNLDKLLEFVRPYIPESERKKLDELSNLLRYEISYLSRMASDFHDI